MDFQIGDRIEGHYGSCWERREFGWFDCETQQYAFCDETADWLVNLKVKMPVVKWVSEKISKTDKGQPETYQYRYTLRRRNAQA